MKKELEEIKYTAITGDSTNWIDDIDHGRYISEKKVNEAIEAAYQLGKDEDRWVSLNDPLPEESGNYLIQCCYSEIKTCYFSDESKRFSNSYGTQDYVNYWQQLPNPPKP